MPIHYEAESGHLLVITIDRPEQKNARDRADGPSAVRATKESVVRRMSGTLREAYKIDSEISGLVFQSEDAKEGPKAFVEKRNPNWINR